MSVKVQSLDTSHASRTIVMAFLGEVKFDENCISEASYDEDKVDSATDAYDYLLTVEEEEEQDPLPPAPPVDSTLENQTNENNLGKEDVNAPLKSHSDNEDDLNKEENANTEEGAATSEGLSTEEMIQALEGKSLAELQEIALDSGFPQGEWRPFRAAKNLKNYLIEKLNGPTA